jgi:hypothetical protein
MTVSDSRETLNAILMLVLLTVSSLVVSGTAEANVHSSSSRVALVLLWARFDLGAGVGAVADVSPRRSTTPDPVVGGLIDCWKFIGDACRGAGEVRAANGSGVDRDACGCGCANVAEGRGDGT